ncbi:MAG: hypothetical protein WBB28_08550 [Crinalium sp.]
MHDESHQKSPQNVLGSEQGDEILRIFQNLDHFTWETFIKTRLPLLKLPEDILYRLQNEDSGKTTDNVVSNSERETVEQIFVLLGFKRGSFLKPRTVGYAIIIFY